jgi:hypothetical protein
MVIHRLLDEGVGFEEDADVGFDDDDDEVEWEAAAAADLND